MIFTACAVLGFLPLSCAPRGGSSTTSSKKECSELEPAQCEKASAIEGKICRAHQNKCIEVKTCQDLTTMGQNACKTDVFAHEKCQWINDQCLIESKILTDFMSKARSFSQKTNVGHSEIADTFMVLAGTSPNYNYKDIKFDFAANKQEVAFNVETTTTAWGTPYSFTYTAADLDADTMLISLKGTTAKTGTVFSVPNVNVVEPFERALLMYQKSTNKLFFLIVYKKDDMAKFSIKKPADFVIPTGTDIKDRGEPHAAFIMAP